jgi:hypothetical protein
LQSEPAWNVKYLEGYVPTGDSSKH